VSCQRLPTLALLVIALFGAGDGATAHLEVHQLIHDRWGQWVGNCDSVCMEDLDHVAAAGDLKGDEAAACAALIQTLHFMDRKRHVTRMGKDELVWGSNEVADRMLVRSYAACQRKLQLVPQALWTEGAPHEAAVSQTGDRTGDCWLLAPTGWMVRNRPEVIRRAVEALPDANYRVRFPSGAVVEVSRPNDVEIIAVNGDATLKDGLWLPVVKEAMGRMLGERNARKRQLESEALRVNGGSMAMMMQHWTGHRVRGVPLAGKTPAEQVRAELQRALDRHAMVGVATSPTPAGRIPPNHAYMVFRFDAERDMVITWNPWNDDYTPKGEAGRENGYARDDGIAEIPLADFIEIFRVMRIETDEAFDGSKPAPPAPEALAPAKP
jgi:hypothetical protein